jgi:hypothetical protein
MDMGRMKSEVSISSRSATVEYEMRLDNNLE